MTAVPGMSPPPLPSELGLRERKKQQTRWAIQSHAIRLFMEQGYEATTVDRICQEAEVSPSTFFRYFPSKEDVVVLDQYDPMIINIFHEAGLTPDPVGTLSSRLREMIEKTDDRERKTLVIRTELALSEPAIRARLMEHLLDTVQMLTEATAPGGNEPQQPGNPRLHPARLFVGACIGAWIAAWDCLKGMEPTQQNLLEFLVEPLSAVRFPGRP